MWPDLVSLDVTPSPESDNPLADIWPGAPGWLVALAVAVLAVIVLAGKLKPLIPAAKWLGGVFRTVFRRPTPEARFRIGRRRHFAEHVELQLKLLASNEDWHDDRFAELEAEVEIEGRVHPLRWFGGSRSRSVLLRREKSLSKALRRTGERLVILEGEPGAGKSVALRHIGQRLAREASKARGMAVIPLYVNLKEFRPERRPVDSDAVREFILATLRRVNDRDVDRFLDEEFDKGLQDGSWLILLDSFDEIPDVLSTAQSSDTLKEYAEAVYTFLHGMKRCRAVIASREFHGLRSFHLPTFKIVRLTRRQQRDLVSRSGLSPNLQALVENGLASADSELRQLAANPMSLSLLCEHVRENGEFPSNAYTTYESYLAKRLERDAERVRSRYDVSPAFVRAVVEESAFSMADVRGLGLSPSRGALRTALVAGGRVSVQKLDAVLDAMEYMKLGRRDGEAQDPAFTFTHRRFQEYFATCVVLRDRDRVTPEALLTEGQWRETAVAVLQTQPPADTAVLLDEAAALLRRMVAQLPEAIPDRDTHDKEAGDASTGDTDAEGTDAEGTDAEGTDAGRREFRWPSGSYHLLRLLSAGAGQAPATLPDSCRADAGRILRAAWDRGRRHDRKWALELSPIADEATTLFLVEQGFAAGSGTLRGAAFDAVGRLAAPSAKLYDGVRAALIEMAASGRLASESLIIRAQISRLPDPGPLLGTLRLLRAAPVIDLLLATGWITAFVALADETPGFSSLLMWAFTAAIAVSTYQLILSPESPLRFPRTRVRVTLPGRGKADPLAWLMRSGLIVSPFVTMLGKSSRCAGSGDADRLCVSFAALDVSLVRFGLALAVAFAFLFLLWPGCVRHAVRHGCVASVARWPLIPVRAVVHVLGASGPISRPRIMGAVVVATSIPVIAGLSAWAVSWLADYKNLVIFVGSIGAALFTGMWIFGLIYMAIERRRETARVLRLAADGAVPGARDLLGTLLELRTSRGVEKWVDEVQRHALAGALEPVRVLSDLLAAIDLTRESPRGVPDAPLLGSRFGTLADTVPDVALDAVPGVSAEFAAWLEQREHRLPVVLRSLPEITLDRMARVVEQVEQAKVTRARPDTENEGRPVEPEATV
ncbi:NACHT domain-containing protein [Microtetraspora sp. AC03309]|uniref:NACHT domain-containing protein n=1 Tax=Microtetraspora sp. AC03309 TaxID=2779376 RepID=UPI001E43472A|nr:NACHT domain-containing protein [Microtetraspora sp. AC03309]MCC5578747.1 NACHT domain-containing protein [Microtetraspora sp. AC03309]